MYILTHTHYLHSHIYTQIRKEREEYSVAELRVRISKLEQALTAEVKRRVQVTSDIKGFCQTQISQVESRLEQHLLQHSSTIQDRMDDLESRLSILETKSDTEAREQLKLVQQKGQDFCQAVETLQREMEGEKKSRLVREGRFLQQLESHSANFEEKWSTERQERIQQVLDLKQDLSLRQQHQVEQQTTWQNRIDAQLNSLKCELQKEEKEREEQDETTIAALNQLTLQLQSSLAILNGE